MVEIKVLGTGCADCVKMYQFVIEALQEMGLQEVRVERVIDTRTIEFGLRADEAPGLLIDGYLAWAGSAPKKDQIMEWIYQAQTVTVI